MIKISVILTTYNSENQIQEVIDSIHKQEGKDELFELELIVIDEIHTPDSSRYWITDTYEERMSSGQEPQNIDKEFLRLWFVDNCDPYNDEILPEAPEELVTELSSRYIYLYETITGGVFPFPDAGKSVSDRINKSLMEVL